LQSKLTVDTIFLLSKENDRIYHSTHNEVAVIQNCVSHPVDNAGMEKRTDCTISKYHTFVTARYQINMDKVAIHYHFSVR
jgi:hypothetical protein